MKTCTKCGIEKPLSEYYKNRNFKSGLHSRCKDCIKAYKKTQVVIYKIKNTSSIVKLTEKKCYYCGENKPSNHFYKNTSKYDGLHSECKECCKL
ncbi:MAG: hypothetical protein Q8T08_06530, partial [Ignavibacteria bacterium]|nr:hypothetical protein [Ignavibacteria bacterium]